MKIIECTILNGDTLYSSTTIILKINNRTTCTSIIHFNNTIKNTKILQCPWSIILTCIDKTIINFLKTTSLKNNRIINKICISFFSTWSSTCRCITQSQYTSLSFHCRTIKIYILNFQTSFSNKSAFSSNNDSWRIVLISTECHCI